MAKIKIQRTDEYSNRLRDYQIYVDGEKIGTVANGEIKDFDVTPGQHSIVAKIDLSSSRELSFECETSDIKTFSVGSFKNSQSLLPLFYLTLTMVS